jgi:hypothetical protein
LHLFLNDCTLVLAIKLQIDMGQSIAKNLSVGWVIGRERDDAKVATMVLEGLSSRSKEMLVKPIVKGIEVVHGVRTKEVDRMPAGIVIECSNSDAKRFVPLVPRFGCERACHLRAIEAVVKIFRQMS